VNLRASATRRFDEAASKHLERVYGDMIPCAAFSARS
jgi:hypothetical protein